MTDTRTNIEKIESIFYDYAFEGDNNRYWELSKHDLRIIAQRIETEVMGITDDNEFVNLKDLTKEK